MVFRNLEKKYVKRSSLSNEKGQALIEYVLMLVVTVAMVLALGYQVFTPFRDFLQNYMGKYIACLLETGELPSLGNETSENTLADQGCNGKFNPASLASGRSPSGSGSSSSSSTNSSKSSSSSSSGDSSGGSSGSGGSGSSSSSNFLTNKSRGRGSSGDKSSGGGEKSVEVPIDASASSFYNRKNSWREGDYKDLSKATVIGGVAFGEAEKKKEERKENARRSVASGENISPPPKKIPVKKPEAKPLTDGEDEPMTFGNFFRILLIAAIIIAVIVMLASQALKLAKSQEK